MSPADSDIAARIRAAELRVVAHDAALWQRVEQARSGWQTGVRQLRWLPVALAAAGALGTAWWLMRRPAPHRVPVRSPSRLATGASPRASLAALASFGMPLIEALLAARAGAAAHPPLPTARGVDLARYMGRWFEIARLPMRYERRCAGQPSAHYALRADGSVRVTNRCLTATGREQVADGVGRLAPGADPAKLEVTFLPEPLRWLPIGWADYWIVHVDADYRFAVVGEPRRRFCWLLARDAAPAAVDRDRLVRIAAAHGFPTERLIHNSA